MKTLKLLGVATALCWSLQAGATETGSGCGLGAEVLEGKSGKGSNVAAAILNGLIIPNTFFMTTGDGMMGCDPTQTVQKDEITEIFVATNMDQISTDIARGDGDYLDVLAALMGVEEADLPSFRKMTQEHYDALFGTSDQNARNMIKSIELAMLSDADLAKYGDLDAQPVVSN